LKKLIHISAFFVLVLLANNTHASTNEGKTNESTNSEKAEENLATLNDSRVVENEKVDDQHAQMISTPVDQQTKDSTNLNSVCKFNYIFYFIYKLKYDDSEEGQTEYLEYSF